MLTLIINKIKNKNETITEGIRKLLEHHVMIA